MKKMVLKYGGIVMFYLVIIGGVFLVNYRFSKVNQTLSNQIAYVEK